MAEHEWYWQSYLRVCYEKTSHFRHRIITIIITSMLTPVSSRAVDWWDGESTPVSLTTSVNCSLQGDSEMMSIWHTPPDRHTWIFNSHSLTALPQSNPYNKQKFKDTGILSLKHIHHSAADTDQSTCQILDKRVNRQINATWKSSESARAKCSSDWRSLWALS